MIIFNRIVKTDGSQNKDEIELEALKDTTYNKKKIKAGSIIKVSKDEAKSLVRKDRFKIKVD